MSHIIVGDAVIHLENVEPDLAREILREDLVIETESGPRNARGHLLNVHRGSTRLKGLYRCQCCLRIICWCNGGSESDFCDACAIAEEDDLP